MLMNFTASLIIVGGKIVLPSQTHKHIHIHLYASSKSYLNYITLKGGLLRQKISKFR